MSNPDDPRSWLGKAGNDLQCIRNNIAADVIPWDVVAYHAQQADEKALKAVLASRGAHAHAHMVWKSNTMTNSLTCFFDWNKRLPRSS